MSKKPGATQAMHKVIMVGSGGVGKSALTLQFMYDEVNAFLYKILQVIIGILTNICNFYFFKHAFYILENYMNEIFFLNFNTNVKISLLKIMNLQKQIPTEKKLY